MRATTTITKLLVTIVFCLKQAKLNFMPKKKNQPFTTPTIKNLNTTCLYEIILNRDRAVSENTNLQSIEFNQHAFTYSIIFY